MTRNALMFIYLDNRKEGFRVKTGYSDEFIALEKV
jgi:hypothetical protein